LHGAGLDPALIRDAPEPAKELLVLLVQQGVQGLAAALPFGLLGLRGPGIFFGLAGSGLERLGPRDRLGPPVDNQQQQDQRPHGAQEHGQKGERRYLQDLPPPPHAPAPPPDDFVFSGGSTSRS
jgi:hypothetical protein